MFPDDLNADEAGHFIRHLSYRFVAERQKGKVLLGGGLALVFHGLRARARDMDYYADADTKIVMWRHDCSVRREMGLSRHEGDPWLDDSRGGHILSMLDRERDFTRVHFIQSEDRAGLQIYIVNKRPLLASKLLRFPCAQEKDIADMDRLCVDQGVESAEALTAVWEQYGRLWGKPVDYAATLDRVPEEWEYIALLRARDDYQPFRPRGPGKKSVADDITP